MKRPEVRWANTASELRAAGVRLELGRPVDARFLEQDLIVVSPGVPSNFPALELARDAGVPVWSEIELAWRFLRGKLMVITGSNGKTTTTALVAHILKRRAYQRWSAETSACRCCRWSNVGGPSVTVAEISSFQLETIERFRPEIGVLLNLTPDHLDRHGSFEEYARAKMRMFGINSIVMRGSERGRSGSDRRMPSGPYFLVQPAETRGPGSISARQSNYFPRMKDRKGRWRGATRFRCAASTTSKTCWRLRGGVSGGGDSRGDRERRKDLSRASSIAWNSSRKLPA